MLPVKLSESMTSGSQMRGGFGCLVDLGLFGLAWIFPPLWFVIIPLWCYEGIVGLREYYFKVNSMAIYNYGIGGNEVKVDANESIAEIPSNRTLIVQKLTDEAPAAPESVYGLETIEDVFQRFEPTVDLCHVDAEGNEIKEIMTFTGLGDFGAKKIKEKSDFLSKLDIEKEQGVRITRQLTSNRALQKALENPEVKNAIMDVIESSIEEILANQKKVEL